MELYDSEQQKENEKIDPMMFSPPPSDSSHLIARLRPQRTLIISSQSHKSGTAAFRKKWKKSLKGRGEENERNFALRRAREEFIKHRDNQS